MNSTLTVTLVTTGNLPGAKFARLLPCHGEFRLAGQQGLSMLLDSSLNPDHA